MAKSRKPTVTNFDQYLNEKLRDSAFAERFERAGEAWEVAMQLAALRRMAGLSQKQLAQRLNTSQQQVSRFESPSYEGHSLAMLRRVAAALGGTVRVVFEPSRSAAPKRAMKEKVDSQQRRRKARNVA
jgi:transcriptional regulator with XRE-family HTH domain